MNVCFLVGSMAISGGTYVILQHASYLSKNGYNVTLAVQEPFTAETLRWHDEASSLNCVPISDAKSQEYDLVIATWWKTAFELCHFQAKHYAYFVQSIESRFYPKEEVPLRSLVESTYKFPLHYITEATWIKDYLYDNHQQSATLVKNGIRKDVYSAHGETFEKGKSPRVLVEGPFGVSFKNTALSIKLAKQAGAKDIWVLTGTPIDKLPFVRRVFSRIPMTETAPIYRSCDILLKLSTVEGMFGPPLEIFHCGGTAIVFNVSGHDEYITHNENAIVVPVGDTAGVVRELRNLLTNPERLKKLKDNAQLTAANWPSWAESSIKFSYWVDACINKEINADIRTTLYRMTDESFAVYGNDEKGRLKTNPWITKKYKLIAIYYKLPPKFVNLIKSWNAKLEILLNNGKVF